MKASTRASVPTVIIVGPTPPPVHGVSQVTGWLVDSPILAEKLRILHLDTSDRRSLENMGRVDVQNVLIGLRSVTNMLRMCALEKPCLVYYTLSQNALALMRDAALAAAARLFGAGSVVQLAGSQYLEIADDGGIAGWLIRRALQRARLVLVLGESQVRPVLGVIGHDRVRVAPNGLPVPAAGLIRRTRRGPCRFLFIGALDSSKGVMAALEAMGTVSLKRAFTATFAGSWGSDQERERIMAAVEQYGLTDVVRFPGVVRGDKKIGLLEGADVYLLPSFAEGQPVSIIEAMAYGLPVISSRVGAIPDTVTADESGILLEPGDTNGLAEAMIRLIDNPDVRIEMGKVGRARYLEYFTLERSHEVLRDTLILAAGTVDKRRDIVASERRSG